MRRKERSAVISGATVILLLGACYVWFQGPPPVLRMSSKRIVVPARRLPTGVSALGAKLTLISAIRARDGSVRVKLRCSGLLTGAKPDIVRVGRTEVRGCDIADISIASDPPEDYCSTEPPADPVQQQITVLLGPTRARTCSVSQQLCLERATRPVLRVTGVTPFGLPTTTRVGDAEVTISRAVMETLAYPARAEWSDLDQRLWRNPRFKGRPLLVVSVDVTVPSDERFDGRLRIRRGRESCEANPPWERDPLHQLDIENCRLIDAGGRLIKPCAYQWVPTTGASTAGGVFEAEAAARTPVEKAVSALSRPLAARMITSRAVRVARRYRPSNRYLVAFAADKLPAKFGFQVPVTLPPDPKDSVWVKFKDVPITRSP